MSDGTFRIPTWLKEDLPLNILEKLNLQHHFEKLMEVEIHHCHLC